jgi:hypothetical protein
MNFTGRGSRANADEQDTTQHTHSLPPLTVDACIAQVVRVQMTTVQEHQSVMQTGGILVAWFHAPAGPYVVLPVE